MDNKDNQVADNFLIVHGSRSASVKREGGICDPFFKASGSRLNRDIGVGLGRSLDRDLLVGLERGFRLKGGLSLNWSLGLNGSLSWNLNWNWCLCMCLDWSLGNFSRSLNWSASNTKKLYRERTKKLEIDQFSTRKLRKTKIEEQNSFQNPVKRNPVKKSVAPKLQNRKSGINDPIGQKLGIIRASLRLKSLKRVITRNDE